MAAPLSSNFKASAPDNATGSHKGVDLGKRTDEEDVLEEGFEGVVVGWTPSEGTEGVRVGSKLSIDSRGSTVTPVSSNGTTVSNSASMRSSDSIRSTSSIRSARAEALRRSRMSPEERLGEDIGNFFGKVFSDASSYPGESTAEPSIAKKTSSLAKRGSQRFRTTGSRDDLPVRSSQSELRREKLSPEEKLGQNLGDFFSRTFSEPR